MNALTAHPVDRRVERTHLFLVATLSFGRASTAVRVRNLSATGALVEGADLPPAGTAIVLRRGALEAVGSLVWSAAGKAGLSFREPVAVSCWLPSKEVKRQTQVDQVAFELKKAARAFDPAPAPVARQPALTMTEVVDDLTALGSELERLGDQLADDASVLARHPEVQLLDAAGQRIGRIIAALRPTPR